MRSRIWMGLGVLFLSAAMALAAFQFVSPRVLPLPVIMRVPDMPLVDQDGRAFSLGQTRGKIAALALIYTHCPDVCPLTTSRMKTLQERIKAAGLDDQVLLVSVTIDPERDTPAVLKQFAEVRKVDLENWVYVTGEPERIQQLVDQLKVYRERVYLVDGTPVPGAAWSGPAPANVPYIVNHTDRVFLADRRGDVRALLPGSRMDVDEAMQLIQQLVAER